MRYLVGDCKPPRGFEDSEANCRVASLAEALDQCGDLADIHLPPGGTESITEPLHLTKGGVKIICSGNPCAPWACRGWLRRLFWRLFWKKGYTIKCDPMFWGPPGGMLVITGAYPEIKGIDFQTPDGMNAFEVKTETGFRVTRCHFESLKLPLPPQTLYVDGAQGFDDYSGRFPSLAVATIQHAIDIARPGDTIRLAPDTPIGEVNVNKDYLTIIGPGWEASPDA